MVHFLPFINTEMSQVVEILPRGRQALRSCTVNDFVTDDQLMQGTRAPISIASI